MARRVRKRSFLSLLSTTVTMRAKRNLVDRQIEDAKLDKISKSLTSVFRMGSDLSPAERDRRRRSVRNILVDHFAREAANSDFKYARLKEKDAFRIMSNIRFRLLSRADDRAREMRAQK